MTKKLLTEETRQLLLKLTAEELLKKSKSLDETSKHLSYIKNSSEVLKTSNCQLDEISRILEFKMLIGFISLDLTSSTRAYLKAEYQYEGLFSLRQFIVVINEGYKKIYNFKNLNQDGIEQLGNRKKSFWIKDIGEIVNKKSNSFLKEKYSNLTSDLNNYFDKNFEGIKEQRSLSIHYDDSLIKVHDMITKLNAETIFKKFIPFYKLLDKMFFFSHELIMSYKFQSLNKE